MNVRWTLLLVLLLSAMLNLFGQQGTSTLTGTVVDPGNAVVPNASARLTNLQNGAVRNAQTGASGEFRFDALIPGEYKLEVNVTGFKSLVVDQIALVSSETRGLGNLTVQLGTASESISVTAEVTPVQTSSSEQSQTVNSVTLSQVTNRGRDPYGYMHLLAGVVDTNQDSRQDSRNTSQGGISINGMDANHTQVVLNGAPVEHMACNACFNFIVPNLDAISEVRVLQNGIQAEFGRISGGGTINFVTKSGTSQYHGSFHWDHRNEGMNANNFFNNRQNNPRPIYRYLTLGGSLGGPIDIPKVIPSKFKGKLFFFYSPEYSTSKQPTNFANVNLPTALERTGDFSQTFYGGPGAGKTQLTINDPTTGKPFPGNVIPKDRIDPTGLALLNQLQLPNGYVNPTQPYNFNASYPMTPGYHRWDHVARWDGNLSERFSLYYSFARDFVNNQVANQVTAGKGCVNQNNPGGSESAHANYTLNPTTVLEGQWTRGFTYGEWPSFCNEPVDAYNRTAALNPPTLRPFPAPTTGFNGVFPRHDYPLYPPKLPNVNYAGGNYQNYSSFNSQPNVPYIAGDNQWTWRADLTKNWGSHAFKFGYYWERSLDFDEPGNSWNGLYDFGSTPANPLDTGGGYANALLGIFKSYTEGSVRSVQQRHLTAAEWYAQDNWKVNSRLTLEYGVRFLHNSPSWDDSHFSARFLPSTYSLASAPRLYYPACKIPGATCTPLNQIAVDPVTGNTANPNFVGNLVPGSGNVIDGVLYPNPTGGTSYQAVGVQPRFGFAYNVGGAGKTVIRGSAGVFQTRSNLNNILRPQQAAPPVSFTPVVFYSTISGLTQSSNGQVIPPSAEGFAPQQKLEGIYQYNLTIERSLGFDTVASVAYVGNFDRHGALTETQNNVALGSYALPQNLFSNTPINPNLLRTQYPGMGLISVGTQSQNLVNYHSLQASLKRRFSHGLTYGATYTFSKSLGLIGGWDPYHTGTPITTAYGATVTLPSIRDWYYGPTPQDRTHFGSVNFAYQIPGAHILGKVGTFALGGWTLSGVTSFSSGAPITPSCSSTAPYPVSDPTWSNGAGGVPPGLRCQAVGDWKNYTQSFNTNFNTAAFAYPTGGTAAAPVINFGNTGVGILRQPSWWNQDMTIAKAFRLSERARATASFQAYNVFNHTEFNAIGTTYSFNAAGANTNPTTGQFTGANQPRQIVLAARFDF